MKTRLTSILMLLLIAMFAPQAFSSSGKEKQNTSETYIAVYNQWLDNPAFENDKVTQIQIVGIPDCFTRGLVDISTCKE